MSELEIRDPQAIETYRELAQASIARYGGRYIVRGGAAQLVEGAPQSKMIVIVEFPTMARA
jgi:uncharacterized protein (DUF1330 family)